MDLMMRLFKEEDGQGLVEYILIIAVISIAIIIFGDDVYDAIKIAFQKVVDALGGGTIDADSTKS
ncbi:MAG: Flp/Fap pilin component [Lachnospiraceae bacterium]|jgi:Flp pilus assembly pilin Flp|nr:Flp/Fap pilin component [Lachnospiraceae bacterium]